MNEQPSKSSRANHSPKTSKIASRRCAGVAARRSTVSCSHAARPALLAQLEEGQDEVVLGREVAIERHLRHARLGDDPVDADRPRAVPAEEPVRGLEHALAAAARVLPGPFSRASWCRDGTDLSRRLPGHPASTAADRHAPTSSITAGTSSSATTSWILGAARAARSRTRCARCGAGVGGERVQRRRQRRAVALAARRWRRPARRRRPAGSGARAARAPARAGRRAPRRAAAARSSAASGPPRRRPTSPSARSAGRPGADRDVQQVEHVGQLGRHRGAPAPRARAPATRRARGRRRPARRATADRPEAPGEQRGEPAAQRRTRPPRPRT